MSSDCYKQNLPFFDVVKVLIENHENYFVVDALELAKEYDELFLNITTKMLKKQVKVTEEELQSILGLHFKVKQLIYKLETPPKEEGNFFWKFLKN